MVAVKQMEDGTESSLELDFWKDEKTVFHLAKATSKADPMTE